MKGEITRGNCSGSRLHSTISESVKLTPVLVVVVVVNDGGEDDKDIDENKEEGAAAAGDDGVVRP